MKFAVVGIGLVVPRIVILLLWLGILGYEIYYFVRHYCLASIILSIIYYIIAALWVWSYFVCCWLDPGYIESYYQEKYLINNLSSENMPDDLQNIDKCKKCELPKPQRTHHCSTCNKCVIRFDHHCPTIGNCVGLYNMKGFILTSVYGGLQCEIFSIMHFILSSNQIEAVVALLFGLVFLVFGLSYVFRIGKNETTVESLKNQPPNIYTKGTLNNLKEIFPTPFHFFVPTRPKIDPFYWNDCGLTTQEEDNVPVSDPPA